MALRLLTSLSIAYSAALIWGWRQGGERRGGSGGGGEGGGRRESRQGVVLIICRSKFIINFPILQNRVEMIDTTLRQAKQKP